jgi:hypothetical protein
MAALVASSSNGVATPPGSGTAALMVGEVGFAAPGSGMAGLVATFMS